MIWMKTLLSTVFFFDVSGEATSWDVLTCKDEGGVGVCVVTDDCLLGDTLAGKLSVLVHCARLRTMVTHLDALHSTTLLTHASCCLTLPSFLPFPFPLLIRHCRPSHGGATVASPHHRGQPHEDSHTPLNIPH